MKLRTELYGRDELIRAIKRNPRFVRDRSLQMMTRLKAAYQMTINRNPWRVGGTGGGVPTKTGSLRDAHGYDIKPWHLKIEVRPEKAKAYGWSVHEGTKYMKKRPWLDYAHEKEKGTREEHYDDFLEDIVEDLAK